MILYYITDRRQFPGSEGDQRRALLSKITEAARANIDFIQLREKDLPIRELERLAHEAMTIVRAESQTTRLLINSRTDIAMAVGADGVHLTSNDIAPSEARAIWMRSGHPDVPIIGVSCHSAKDVESASSNVADFAVLAPIFGKIQTGAPGIGLQALREATGIASKRDVRVEAGERRERIPVLALGGVTALNARQCIEAGAAGIAGIRLFQEGDARSPVLDVARAPSLANSALALPDARKIGAPFEYRRRLPHYQGNDQFVFLTFRTSNGFLLSEPVRDIVLSHCLADHGKRYELIGAVVMPDHVHLIVRPKRDSTGELYRLCEIMQSLKGSSAHAINSYLRRKGAVWQHESFDHVLRRSEKVLDTLEYMATNPVRKGLVKDATKYRWTWISEQLEESE